VSTNEEQIGYSAALENPVSSEEYTGLDFSSTWVLSDSMN